MTETAVPHAPMQARRAHAATAAGSGARSTATCSIRSAAPGSPWSRPPSPLLFFAARDLRAAARGAEPVRSGAASTDEFADRAAVDRRRPEPVPARHRRTGPRRACPPFSTACAFRSRSACSASSSPARSASLLGLIAGYVGGAVDGLIMRIADVQLTFPADPDRAAGQRRRQIACSASRLDADEHAGGAGVRDRPEFLGAICPHRARLGAWWRRTRTMSRRRS